MAYREVGGQKTYYKLNETEPGTTLVEGIFRREFRGKYGQQYEFEADDGRIIVLSATGQLRYKMDFIREGMRVKIVYEGQEILSNGTYKGRPAHQFTVLADDDYQDSSPSFDSDSEDDSLSEDDEDFTDL